MAKLKLTQRFAEQSQQPRGVRTFVWDDALQGFGLKIYPSGARSWIFKFNGRERVLGGIGAISETEARAKASRMRADIYDKKNPFSQLDIASERLAVETVRATLTIEAGFKAFSDSKKAFYGRTEKYRRDTLNLLRRHILSDRSLARKKIEAFGPLEMQACLDRIPAESWATKNQVINAYKRMVSFLRLEPPFGRVLQDSPPHDFKQLRAEPRIRQDCLNAEQLRKIYESLNELGNEYQKALVEFAILTTRRIGTVAEMRWEQLDLLPNSGPAIWRIPANKNRKGKGQGQGRVEHLPLTTRMLNILSSLKRDGDWVFGGKTPTHPSAKLRNKIKEISGISADPDGNHWTYHGFRRSLASSEIAAEHRYTIDKIQGRKEIGSARSYFQGQMLESKLKVLELWDHLLFPDQSPGNTYSTQAPLPQHTIDHQKHRPPTFSIACYAVYKTMRLAGEKHDTAIAELQQILPRQELGRLLGVSTVERYVRDGTMLAKCLGTEVTKRLSPEKHKQLRVVVAAGPEAPVIAIPRL